jgi:hypothetical protein
MRRGDPDDPLLKTFLIFQTKAAGSLISSPEALRDFCFAETSLQLRESKNYRKIQTFENSKFENDKPQERAKPIGKLILRQFEFF